MLNVLIIFGMLIWENLMYMIFHPIFHLADCFLNEERVVRWADLILMAIGGGIGVWASNQRGDIHIWIWLMKPGVLALLVAWLGDLAFLELLTLVTPKANPKKLRTMGPVLLLYSLTCIGSGTVLVTFLSWVLPKVIQ